MSSFPNEYLEWAGAGQTGASAPVEPVPPQSPAAVRSQNDDISTWPRVTLAQARVRPHLDFVLPGLLSGSVGLIVGQGAIGKSYLSLAIGYGIASGKDIPGIGIPPVVGDVMLVMGEDPPEILQERLYWLRDEVGISDQEATAIDPRLTLISGRGRDLRLMQKGAGGVLDNGPFFGPLMRAATGKRLVILDPLAFLSDGDENDNASMTRLMTLLYEVARLANTTIVVLHHVSKGGKGDRESWTAARGAGAITSAARWQVSMSPIPQAELDDLGIAGDVRMAWVRVATDKINYGEAPAPALLRRGRGGVLMAEPPPRDCEKAIADARKDAAKVTSRRGASPAPAQPAQIADANLEVGINDWI